MTTRTAFDHALHEYNTALAAFKAARDRVTAAKQALSLHSGKAITPQLRESQRRASRRAQVLRAHSELRQLGKQARRQAVDQILAQRDAPKVWTFYLDDMKFTNGVPKVFRSNRERFKLYKAALHIGVTRALGLSAQARRLSCDANEPQQNYAHNHNTALEYADTARTLELHLQGLVDASPRQVEIHYPSEWRAISSALRPDGSKPKSKGAMKLYSLYQHIIRTHKESGA